MANAPDPVARDLVALLSAPRFGAYLHATASGMSDRHATGGGARTKRTSAVPSILARRP